MNVVRAFGLILLLSGTLFADVLVLKDGSKVSGRVVDKGLHYEVTTDSGLRTWLRDEVDRVVTSPKELLGDADKNFEDAKKEYGEAIALQDPAEKNARLKEAIEKVRGVREALASTRELFPEDRYADLDQKLMQAMQLMRLLRERVSVDVARAPAMINPRGGSVGGSAAYIERLPRAISVLVDPAQRADPEKKAWAVAAFREQKDDFTAAARLFLARPEAEWRLQGGAVKALADYFAKPWVRDPSKQTGADHLKAAAWLAEQIASIRKTEPSASVEALQLFGAAHLSQAEPGPEAAKAAAGLNLILDEGVAGTREGQAVHDLDGWIASGDFDLAALAFVKEFRDVDTPAVRYVWAYALTCIAHAKKKGFERAIAAYGSIQTASAAVKEHLAAMQKSIKAAALCSNCLGEGKLRCTNCHGIKEVRFPCAKCGGKGKYLPPGLVQPPGGGRMRGPTYMTCLPCKGTGYEKVLRCEKCKDGYLVCRQCDGKPKSPPDFDDLCARVPCPDCDGRGSALRNVRWACPSCLGLGQKLSPKAEPSKVLP
ncbi:MAG: hypothetical protein JO332_05965 [Planctomycetaceae bacterium]|nr:hypothetical protein [Planctomycetaceae bacterium]